MSRDVVLLLVLLSLPRAVSAQHPRTSVSEESLQAASVSSLASRIVVGAAVAAGLSWALLPIGAELLGPQGGEDPGLLGAIAGFSVGSVLGTAIGAYGVARAHGSETSFAVFLGSSLAGYFALGALGSLVHVENATVGWIAFYAIPAAVVGVITHQADRRAAEERRFDLELSPGPNGWRVGATVRF